jgi:hypothetical protein
MYVAAGLLMASLGLSSDIDPHEVDVAEVDFEGRRAIRLTHQGTHSFALVRGVAFRDGDIAVEVAGTVDPELPEPFRSVARGFIGLAFRVQEDPGRYEVIYLRPTNARSDDQVRRNHTVQYASVPDHGWRRLRTEAPGRYESYADLEAGSWTRMRIAVRGTTARLFVGSAEQPCLVVNDLKLGDTAGRVGLWIGSGTIGYFRELEIVPADPAR